MLATRIKDSTEHDSNTTYLPDIIFPFPPENEILQNVERTRRALDQRLRALGVPGASVCGHGTFNQEEAHAPTLRSPTLLEVGSHTVLVVESQQDPFQFRKQQVQRLPLSTNNPLPRNSVEDPRPRNTASITEEERADWKIPTSISNYVNPKGHVIPLDIRALHDGSLARRQTRTTDVSDGHAVLAHALEDAHKEVAAFVQNEARLRQKHAEKKQMEEDARILAMQQALWAERQKERHQQKTTRCLHADPQTSKDNALSRNMQSDRTQRRERRKETREERAERRVQEDQLRQIQREEHKRQLRRERQARSAGVIDPSQLFGRSLEEAVALVGHGGPIDLKRAITSNEDSALFDTRLFETTAEEYSRGAEQLRPLLPQSTSNYTISRSALAKEMETQALLKVGARKASYSGEPDDSPVVGVLDDSAESDVTSKNNVDKTKSADEDEDEDDPFHVKELMQKVTCQFKK